MITTKGVALPEGKRQIPCDPNEMKKKGRKSSHSQILAQDLAGPKKSAE